MRERVTEDYLETLITDETYFTAAQGFMGTRVSTAVKGMDDTDDVNVIAGQAATDSRLPSTSPLSSLTFCVLSLKNGFTVTGESACVNSSDYNQAIGERIARQNAVNKLWMLEGYLLRQLKAEAAEGCDNACCE